MGTTVTILQMNKLSPRKGDLAKVTQVPLKVSMEKGKDNNGLLECLWKRDSLYYIDQDLDPAFLKSVCWLLSEYFENGDIEPLPALFFLV